MYIIIIKIIMNEVKKDSLPMIFSILVSDDDMETKTSLGILYDAII